MKHFSKGRAKETKRNRERAERVVGGNWGSQGHWLFKLSSLQRNAHMLMEHGLWKWKIGNRECTGPKPNECEEWSVKGGGLKRRATLRWQTLELCILIWISTLDVAHLLPNELQFNSLRRVQCLGQNYNGRPRWSSQLRNRERERERDGEGS